MNKLKSKVNMIVCIIILILAINIQLAEQVLASEITTKINSFNVESNLYVNKDTTVQGSATSASKVLYEFWVMDYSSGTWQLVQQYSESNTYIWKPIKVGRYRVEMHVKDINSSKYFDTNAFRDVEVNNIPPAKVSSFTTDSSFYFNKPGTAAGSGTSVNKVLYEFWVLDYSTGNWQVVQQYSESNKLNWTPTKAGKYRIEMHIKDSQSTRYFDDNAFKDIDVKMPAPAIISSLNMSSEFYINQQYKITGSGSSENKVLYEYWLMDYSKNEWQLIQNYSENSVLNWTPVKAGRYRIELHVKDIYSNRYFDSNAYKDIEVDNAPPAKINSFAADTNAFYINKPIVVSSSGSGTNKVLYQYWLMDYSAGSWQVLQDYSENSILNWTPKKVGKYRIELHVKDSQSIRYFDSNVFKDIDAKEPVPAKVTSFSVPNDLYINHNHIIQGGGTSENTTLYQFWIMDYSEGTWKIVQDYSTNGTFTWNPTKIGKYRVEMHVKDVYSSNSFDNNAFRDVEVSNVLPAKISRFDSPDKLYVNHGYVIQSEATSTNPTLYQYWLMDYSVGSWQVLQDYSENSTLKWTPTKVGNYRIELHVKDPKSIKNYDDNAFKDITVNHLGISGKTIVVDAGHNYGGDDGANATFGSTTYYERYLNMFMALKLRDELQKFGATVIFTREASDASKDDLDTSLKNRVDIANNAKADLFISLHHDKSADPATTGISTHYSTYKPGIDNSGVVKGDDPNGWNKDVDIDTTPCKEAIMGRDLAYRLADGLSSSLGYNNLKAHDHNLFVTKNTNMPAILIENGFISNQAEAQRCNDSNQQTLKAQAIAKIVNDYYLTID